MNVAIQALSSNHGGLSGACWIGSAALSVSGVFIVQYLAITTFPIANNQIRALISDTGETTAFLPNQKWAAWALAGPPILVLWSTTLFIAGLMHYVIRTHFDKPEYRSVSIFFLAVATLHAIGYLVIGEWIETKLYNEVRSKRHTHHRLTVQMFSCQRRKDNLGRWHSSPESSSDDLLVSIRSLTDELRKVLPLLVPSNETLPASSTFSNILGIQEANADKAGIA